MPPITCLRVAAAEFAKHFGSNPDAVRTVDFLNYNSTTKENACNSESCMQLLRIMRKAPVVFEDANSPDHSPADTL